MNSDEAITFVELTPLEDAIATAIYDYQRSVGLDDEAAGEDAFGIMRAVATVIQQAFAEVEAARWKQGYSAGAYRADWRGDPKAAEIDNEWLEWKKREDEALAAKGDSRG